MVVHGTLVKYLLYPHYVIYFPLYVVNSYRNTFKLVMMVAELRYQEKKKAFLFQKSSNCVWSNVFHKGRVAFKLCFRISIRFTLNFQSEEDT